MDTIRLSISTFCSNGMAFMKKHIEVGDWIKVKVIGIDRPMYVVEKIDGDEYHLVQKEKSYEHRMVLDKSKIEKV